MILPPPVFLSVLRRYWNIGGSRCFLSHEGNLELQREGYRSQKDLVWVLNPDHVGKDSQKVEQEAEQLRAAPRRPNDGFKPLWVTYYLQICLIINDKQDYRLKRRLG